MPAIVLLNVFRADMFIPSRAQGAPIGDECRPRHREDAFIFDGEFELQSLALVLRINVISPDIGPLFAYGGPSRSTVV